MNTRRPYMNFRRRHESRMMYAVRQAAPFIGGAALGAILACAIFINL
jgi:hypothetical protein